MLLLFLVALSVSGSSALPVTIVQSSPPEVVIPRTPPQMPIINPSSGEPRSCPPTALDEAARRGGKLMSHKLTELPPGTPYMAVWRHVGGCVAPLTMVDYRNPRRR